jgi:catechol 2,3-dioxygenase-like lactoylglutathione lyase family enzyme
VNDAGNRLGIQRVVAYLHVVDVARSIAFYESLGMECRARMGPEGEPFWAAMRCAGGDLMLGQADGPVDPRVQSVMFYLYAPDLDDLRGSLLESGLRDGGEYTGDTSAGADAYPPSGVVFTIKHPPYLPTGEMRVHDPDGYVLQIARLDAAG